MEDAITDSKKRPTKKMPSSALNKWCIFDYLFLLTDNDPDMLEHFSFGCVSFSLEKIKWLVALSRIFLWAFEPVLTEHHLMQYIHNPEKEYEDWNKLTS